MAALARCSPPDQANGGAVTGSGSAGIASAIEWPFWPTSMRIHPASMVRIDETTGQPVIEARLEFRRLAREETSWVRESILGIPVAA